MSAAHSKTAFVTGGSEGIGLACARALLEDGYTVCLMARSAQKLASAQATLAGPGRSIVVQQADVSVPEQVERAVSAFAAQCGGIDVLIHAAGCSMHALCALEKVSPEEYLRVMRTNADSTFWVSRAVLPYMKEQNSGDIVYILSTATRTASAGYSVYSASKFAANALAQTLAAECSEEDIRVFSVSPGPVDTGIWAHKDVPPSPELRQKMLRPETIAQLVLFLLRQPRNVCIGDVVVTPRTPAPTPRGAAR